MILQNMIGFSLLLIKIFDDFLLNLSETKPRPWNVRL